MKTITGILFFTFASISPAVAQSNAVASDLDAKEYNVKSIFVGGEIENPGEVDFNSLTLRSVSVKEVEFDEKGKSTFKGAFFYSGFSLYDILSQKKVKKLNEKDFGPTIDLYVIVENARGEKAVFSWGEIFQSNNEFSALITKTARGINPSKMKTRWQLPQMPRLIAADDFYNSRFIENPTRITVISFAGQFATEKPKDIFSPEIKVLSGSQSYTISQIAPTIERRKYSSVGYGHGMGFKGVQSTEGFLLKEVLSDAVKLGKDYSRNGIIVVSAKDGYRAVFSVSEILNRNDNRDFLVVDTGTKEGDGRFNLFVAPDFFVDRNVKAIEKIEIAGIN